MAARWRYGWVLLGWGLFAGNLCYYLYNHRMDNRTFVIPGLVGLSMLAGLGAAAGPWRRSSPRRLRVWVAACLVVPAILLVANWTKVDRNGNDDWWWVCRMHRLAAGPVPQDTAFVMTSWPGNSCRYMFHVWTNRPDVTVVNVQTEWMREAILYFLSRSRLVVIPAFHLRDEDEAQRLLDQAPVWMSDLGLIVVPPNAAVITLPLEPRGK